MKPKNRVYCREIGREKLLFETEKKALTFIKFNSDSMEKKPERVYYCVCCGGYHVTSLSVQPTMTSRTSQVMEMYNACKRH